MPVKRPAILATFPMHFIKQSRKEKLSQGEKPKAPSLEINKRNELIYKAQASNKEKTKPKRSAQAQE